MFFMRYSVLLLASALAFISLPSKATVVEIQTSIGTIEVNLFDNTTPETVENFLSYVNSGAYASNVVHRSVNGFVIQAGGYQYTGPITGNFTLDAVAQSAAVVNEPELSNVRGTIAMAKLSGQPNSATSQWFINLADNSANLDPQNGGFTVFGQVTSNDMQVVDNIADLSVLDAGGAFTDVPLQNYTQTDLDNDEPITDEHLVVIADIVVTDSSADSSANLNPTANTLINAPTAGESNDSGGGSFGWLLIFLGMGFFARGKSAARGGV